MSLLKSKLKRKTQDVAVARARIKLTQAINRACTSFGEAQWINGYRAGKNAGGDDTLYQKEMKFWGIHGRDCSTVARLIMTFQAAVKRSQS